MKRKSSGIIFTIATAAILTAVYPLCSKTLSYCFASEQSQVRVTSANASHSISNQLEVPVSKLGKNEQILQRYAYTVSYNKATRNPNWVAWHLTSSHTKGKFYRNGINFVEDEDVKSPRATNWDYSRSGYDRGHMCPSGDNKWSERAQVESFIYTNCCPQIHAFNDGVWNELESRCRHWANVYGEVYIACGPLYTSKQPKTIGKNKVAVPDSFYKVVLRLGKQPAAIGFTFRNSSAPQSLRQNVHSVDEIEKLTGIDFFPALDDKTERQVEATADLSQWK